MYSKFEAAILDLPYLGSARLVMPLFLLVSWTPKNIDEAVDI